MLKYENNVLLVAVFVLLLFVSNCSSGGSVVSQCPVDDPTPPNNVTLENTLPLGDISFTIDAGPSLGIVLNPVWRDHYDLSYTHLRYADEPGFQDLVTKLNPRSWRTSIGRWEIGMPPPPGATSDNPDTLIQIEREFYRGGNNLTDADDISNYNFTYLDNQLDSLIAQGTEPFLSFDYMPYTLAKVQETANPFNFFRNNGEAFSFSNGIRNSPPASPTVYARVVRNVIRHVLGKFPVGGRDYGVIYFEVGNEPEIGFFWAGTRQEWISTYGAIAAEIQSDVEISSLIKLGGGSFALPLTELLNDIVGDPPTIGSTPTFLREFIQDIAQNNVRLDFLSYHFYHNDPDSHFLSMWYVDSLIQTYSPLSELINGEWGLDLGNGRDAIYDQIEHGLFRAKVMMGMQAYGIKIAHESLFRDPAITSCSRGQLGLIATGPARGKPASDVYQALNKMNGSLQAVNISNPAGTFVVAGKDVAGTRVVVIFVAEEPEAEGQKNVSLVVNNLPWGTGNFVMNRYEVSENTWENNEGVKQVETQSGSGGSFNTTLTYTSAQLMIWELIAQ